MITIPGNHDSRNVGYVHFEELIGPRSTVLRKHGITFVAVDSSEPDLDNGTVGRGRYPWIEEQFAPPADFRVFVLHHHLLPIPGTGRERNVVHDAGDTLEVLQRAKVNLVLSGHKHVPYAWRLEDLFVVNAGTVSSLRLRGHTRPCYNVVEIARRPGRRLPPVPVPRPRADHPLLDPHAGLREAPAPAPGAADAPAGARAGRRRALPAGGAGRARAGRPRRPTWWRRCCSGGTEKLAGEPDYGVPLETLSGDAALRSMLAAPPATAPTGCSTCPTSRC